LFIVSIWGLQRAFEIASSKYQRYVQMLWALCQLGICVSSLVFTTLHSVAPNIKDYGHEILPKISTTIPHVLAWGVVGVAYVFGSNHLEVFTQVYAPAMFVKATLMPLTILPDANPECKVWHPLHCLTRNDMLPSGHMIMVTSAALCLPAPALVFAGITGITLVASRMHFSVDVVLSSWIVYFFHALSLKI